MQALLAQLGLLGISASLVAQQVSPANGLLELATETGPFAALVVFFVWIGHKREERLAKTIDDLQTFIRNDLKQLNEKAINEIVANRGVSERLLQEVNEFFCDGREGREDKE